MSYSHPITVTSLLEVPGAATLIYLFSFPWVVPCRLNYVFPPQKASNELHFFVVELIYSQLFYVKCHHI